MPALNFRFGKDQELKEIKKRNCKIWNQQNVNTYIFKINGRLELGITQIPISMFKLRAYYISNVYNRIDTILLSRINTNSSLQYHLNQLRFLGILKLQRPLHRLRLMQMKLVSP